MQSKTLSFGGLPVGKGHQQPLQHILVPVCFCAKQEQLRWLTEHHAAPCMSFWAEGMRQSFPEAQTAGCRMSCAAILEVAEACLARRSRHTGGGTHSLLQLAVLMLQMLYHLTAGMLHADEPPYTYLSPPILVWHAV